MNKRKKNNQSSAVQLTLAYAFMKLGYLIITDAETDADGSDTAGVLIAVAEIAGAAIAGAEIAGAEIAGAAVAGAQIAVAWIAGTEMAAAGMPDGLSGTK